MRIDDETAAEIGIALNEATLLGVEYAPEFSVVGLTIAGLMLPDPHSPEPSDPRRQIILTKVGRIAAALRDAWWDDLTAETIPFDVSELLAIVQSFGGQRIYGWEFINHKDTAFDHWKHALSLDFVPPNGSFDNRISLFQEDAAGERHLDLWVWFDDLLLGDTVGNRVALSDFIAAGKRWWEAWSTGDSRTHGHGIVPLTDGGKSVWDALADTDFQTPAHDSTPLDEAD